MTTTTPDLDLKVRLDPRVEALMGALALAVPRLPDAGWLNHRLRRRACRQWRGLRGHEAPRLVRRLLGRAFWVDDLCGLAAALLVVCDGRLEPRMPACAIGDPALVRGFDSFAHALVDFADVTRLHEFLEDGAGIPQEVLDGIGGRQAIVDYLRRLRRLLGSGPEVIRILPSPLCAAHLGFGPTVRSAGSREAWVVFGPVWRPVGRRFELVGFRSPKLARLVRHELGHAHLNHQTADSAAVAALAYLFTPLEADMRRQGYGRWDVCLNEMILRALEIRLTHDMIGGRAAERATVREESKGFRLVRPVLLALEEIAETPLCEAMPHFLRALERSARRITA